jgi:4-hydroxy-3-methylbut-2-enyl diphosphate reductase
MHAQHKRVVVVSPHGFCTGVVRAIETAEAALEKFGAPLYCLNEVVHNRQVVDDLASRGVIFVKDLDLIPEQATVLFSAHGVSPEVHAHAARRGLRVIDATCPFVAKVHAEVRRYAARGYSILLVGHRNHDEIIGVRGEAPQSVTVIQNEADARAVQLPASARVAVLTQTTLSIDESAHILNVLRGRFPRIETPPAKDICYATEHRQRAVKALAREADLILVLGSPNSSNSRRLVEVATGTGCPAALVSDLPQLRGLDLRDARCVGITSGASTPESFLNACVDHLTGIGFRRDPPLVAVNETALRFPLPREVRG